MQVVAVAQDLLDQQAVRVVVVVVAEDAELLETQLTVR
jgi:hypothetical protein